MSWSLCLQYLKKSYLTRARRLAPQQSCDRRTSLTAVLLTSQPRFRFSEKSLDLFREVKNAYEAYYSGGKRKGKGSLISQIIFIYFRGMHLTTKP